MASYPNKNKILTWPTNSSIVITKRNKSGVPQEVYVQKIRTREVTQRKNINGRQYEEITFHVKNDSVVVPRGPGRPRKLARSPIVEATDVIYLSNARSQCPPKYIPLKTRAGRGRRGGGRGRGTSNIRGCPRLNRCVGCSAPRPTTTIHHTQTLSTIPGPTQPVVGGRLRWSADLTSLVNSWDYLPDRLTEELRKWLCSSGSDQQVYPQVVRNCHALVLELFPPALADSLQEYCAWLNTIDLSGQLAAEPPKVVVENQPSSLQDCCQWSSMAANQELTES